MDQVPPFVFTLVLAFGVILASIYVLLPSLHWILMRTGCNENTAFTAVLIGIVIVFFGWPIVYDFQSERIPRNLFFTNTGNCRTESGPAPSERGFRRYSQTFICSIKNVSNRSVSDKSIQVVKTVARGSCEDGFVFPPLVYRANLGVGTIPPDEVFSFPKMS